MTKYPTLRNDGGSLQRIDDLFSWDPLDQFANARRTVNTLLDTVMSPRAAGMMEWAAPAVNLFEKDGKYVIEAAIPGLKKDDIEIRISDDRLTLTANRQEEKTEENARYHYRELRRGGFARTITFPQPIDDTHVEAEYTNGVLRITVPMAQAAKAKKVQIKG
jgi:HSP20 family protein